MSYHSMKGLGKRGGEALQRGLGVELKMDSSPQSRAQRQCTGALSQRVTGGYNQRTTWAKSGPGRLPSDIWCTCWSCVSVLCGDMCGGMCEESSVHSKSPVTESKGAGHFSFLPLYCLLYLFSLSTRHAYISFHSCHILSALVFPVLSGKFSLSLTPYHIPSHARFFTCQLSMCRTHSLSHLPYTYLLYRILLADSYPHHFRHSRRPHLSSM